MVCAMSCAIPCATCGIFVEPLVEIGDGIAVVTVILSVGIAVTRLFGIETSQVKNLSGVKRDCVCRICGSALMVFATTVHTIGCAVSEFT